MPFHPQIQNLADAFAASGLPPYWTLTPAEARVQLGGLNAMMPRGPELPRVTNLALSGPNATALPARLYQPDSARALIVYFHGGGWVMGSLDDADAACRTLAVASRCAVLSVDYRLAPEHPFPAAFHDAMAATGWACSNDIGLDRVFVAGDSAGGNLAAVVAQHRAHLPAGGAAVIGQVLIYPVTAPAFDTPSYIKYAESALVTADAMRWFWGHYAPAEADRRDYRAAPLLAPSHAGAVPALFLLPEYDVLHSEGEALAEAMSAADVEVEIREYPGMSHGFFTFVGLVDDASRASQHVADWIGRQVDNSANGTIS